jgi:breast cancer 2 susceptibility protein
LFGLFSEFDVAAVIVHVGEVFTAPHQKKQWVFVTDGSISESQPEELSNSLLAISFCTPYINDGSFAPINSNLVGSTVSISCSFQSPPRVAFIFIK